MSAKASSIAAAYRLALGQIIIERATFGCASSGCLIGISSSLEYRYVIIPGDVPA